MSHCVTLLFLFVVCTAEQACASQSGVDEGRDIPHHSNTNLLHVNAFTSSVNDLKQMASSHYLSLTGRSQADVAAKLNLYAAEHPSVLRVVPCLDLTSSEVASIAQKLKVLTDEGIRMALPEGDGRQVYADPEVASFFDSPTLHKLQCAETMKLWAHHIPTSIKNDPSVSFTVPAVPTFDQDELIAELSHQNKTLSCVAGHTVVDFEELEEGGEGLDETDWPHWPRKINFRGKGHGPYPFWQFGIDYSTGYAPQWKINETYRQLYEGADLEVWSNTAKKATTFYHAHCNWNYVGFGGVNDGPCMAMQRGMFESDTNDTVGNWFLFTANSSTRRSNGKFCCSSSLKTPGNRNLGTINRKFMDNMKYFGIVDFHGHYYNGPAKQYIMAMENSTEAPETNSQPKLPLEVWYQTDMEDKPLLFAEIGQSKRFLQNNVLLSRDFPFLYEEMDPTSFSETFSDSIFDLPEMCEREDVPSCMPGPQYRHGLAG